MSESEPPVRIAGSRCQELDVPEAVCYVRFGHAEVKNSTSYDRCTVRGEMLILDFDEAGRIVGIELVGAGKPCQDIAEDEGGIHAD